MTISQGGQLKFNISAILKTVKESAKKFHITKISVNLFSYLYLIKQRLLLLYA